MTIDLPTSEEPVRVIHGEALDVLQRLPDAYFDAVITDPPYSSGGMVRSDRMQSVSAKYVQTGSDRFSGADFSGDNRDQRSFAYWCQLWLSEAMRCTRPGGYILAFIDWRQLPVLTDAIQAGGWVWRGILSWDKVLGARAAAPHYFRHQCEYIVWGTRGAADPLGEWPPIGKGCYPGSYFCPVKQDDKHHVTGKPTRLLRDLVFCVPPGGKILDPFAGSGTTGVAAAAEGRQCVLIEQGTEYVEIARNRISRALCRDSGNLFAELAITTEGES